MHDFLIKRKLIIVSIVLVLILLCIVFFPRDKKKDSDETTHIFEIRNTQMIYASPYSKIATVEKHYMIIQPPKDLRELKIRVEEYDNDHPIDMEMVKNEITDKQNISADEIEEIDVYIKFYRESRNLPRDWQPKEGHMSTDEIEHHGDDCIASIVYSDIAQQKWYLVMTRRNEGDSLIPIESIEYIDDEVVRHNYRE